jgi:hypothetical protein
MTFRICCLPLIVHASISPASDLVRNRKSDFDFPQGLKPSYLLNLDGSAEAEPFQIDL